MYVEEELRMVGGREFQTVGAATLKPREAKVVRTRGTDIMLLVRCFLLFQSHFLQAIACQNFHTCTLHSWFQKLDTFDVYNSVALI